MRKPKVQSVKITASPLKGLVSNPSMPEIAELRAMDRTDCLAISAEEGQYLFDLVKERDPQVILEVGTGHGYSARWMLLAMGENATLYTIDRENYAYLLESQFIGGHKMVSLHGQLRGLLNQIPDTVDLVFLDSQHQIEKIAWDVEMIEGRLSDDGVIAVHDTEYCPEMGRCLSDYFNGIDSDRLKAVGVRPSKGAWNYEGVKTEYGLGIAYKTGKGKP